MRGLRRRPEREFAANRVAGDRFPVRNAGMRFYWRVIVAFIEEPVFTSIVRLRKASLDVTKLIGHSLVNITDTRFVVDLDLWMCQGLLDTHQLRQNFIFYMNKFYGFVQYVRIKCSDSSHRVADVARLADCQSVLVLAGREYAKLLRQVFTGNHSKHAR